MRTTRALAAFLLAVGLCFVPGVGHGEIREWVVNSATRAYYIDVKLLEARVSYMMMNPTNFLAITLYYDPAGIHTGNFPEGVTTKGKIFVTVHDSRRVFPGKSGVTLLGRFKRELEVIYSFVDHIATNMRTDIVAKFYTREDIPLGYFYQGEYHLWPRQQQRVSDSSKRPKRSYPGLGGGHWIAEKIERGRQIKLEDGSLWKISVRHRLKTMLWETSQQITVAENDDLLYPYRLINQNTGDTVEAELVSE